MATSTFNLFCFGIGWSESRLNCAVAALTELHVHFVSISRQCSQLLVNFTKEYCRFAGCQWQSNCWYCYLYIKIVGLGIHKYRAPTILQLVVGVYIMNVKRHRHRANGVRRLICNVAKLICLLRFTRFVLFWWDLAYAPIDHDVLCSSGLAIKWVTYLLQHTFLLSVTFSCLLHIGSVCSVVCS